MSTFTIEFKGSAKELAAEMRKLPGVAAVKRQVLTEEQRVHIRRALRPVVEEVYTGRDGRRRMQQLQREICDIVLALAAPRVSREASGDDE